jgi:pyruvate,water dikinase
VLTGLGVSAGVARGPARVVRTPDQLPDVRTGEVLVCEATSPSWTPVFERLAGCVCDSGGMLAHAATISREYGLPCVCAVGDATSVISDGDFVEVDGTAGTVRLLPTCQGEDDV